MKTVVKKKQNLLEFVKEWLNQSSNKARFAVSHEWILLDGQPCTDFNFVLQEGMVLEYQKKEFTYAASKSPFPLLYDDDYLLAVNKPAGLLTYGKKGEPGTSVYKLMKNFVKPRNKRDGELYVIHRLDKEVSGVLLFAKKHSAQDYLKENWFRTRKMYFALVEGHLKQEKGTIKSWIDEEPLKVRSVEEGKGSLAITHFNVIKEVGEYTLLNVEIETGRKNQIRVHLSEMGFPIVGDRKYGADDKFRRQIRLQSYFLSFPHPELNKDIEIKIPMRSNFLKVSASNEVY